MLRRSAPASAMQKTYDECYLIASTAIYFEGKNNEQEALRAWRNALDQIYYHNAYKMPSSFQPRTETEKALQDSLRDLELQCKERVDLLEALRKSKLEAERDAKMAGDGPSKSRESLPLGQQPTTNGDSVMWLGGDTVPQASYEDLPRPSPGLERRPAPPPRPPYLSKNSSSDDVQRTKSLQTPPATNLAPPTDSKPRARTPSPEKKGGMLKTLRSNPKERSSSSKMVTTLRNKPPTAATKAATQVWAAPQRQGSAPDSRSASGITANGNGSTMTWDPYTRSLVEKSPESNPELDKRASDAAFMQQASPFDYILPQQSNSSSDNASRQYPELSLAEPASQMRDPFIHDPGHTVDTSPPPAPPPHRFQKVQDVNKAKPAPQSLSEMAPSTLSYLKEFPDHPPNRPKRPPGVPPKRVVHQPHASPTGQSASTSAISRKSVGGASGVVSATTERQRLDIAQSQHDDSMIVNPDLDRRRSTSSSPEPTPRRRAKRKAGSKASAVTPPTTDAEESQEADQGAKAAERKEWDKKVKKIMKNLPRGVDEAAAKQIFNEIVIQGDEVHWDDVAGLEIAKSALKETVVYPFLRPDLFMGLREPARGMLLFGPPGTGKTMLARAVATESKSVFFAISASSLTSKYLGESEKLVRALFALAKALAPSIIFVDEIDSLLGSRGGSSEHEATRRIKTEFLIQWSDLQKAAAGREEKDGAGGDAMRVLVLAATNTPWAIDEAARRRFVRRQYIPLPEDWVREQQLRTLISHQKHQLTDQHIKKIVALTEGFSGSDITALAKDAAMGPLRSLGEKLLHMQPEQIRGIGISDFEASLINIRPSVSKRGLEEFEQWAREFGERGG